MLKEALILCNKIHYISQGIENVEGFDKWFNPDNSENPFVTEIDKDITSEDFYCVVYNFKLVYYDANENPYKCNVQF